MEIPETINTQTLVKDLAKEIRLVEVNGSSENFAFSLALICSFKSVHIKNIIRLLLLTKQFLIP